MKPLRTLSPSIMEMKLRKNVKRASSKKRKLQMNKENVSTFDVSEVIPEKECFFDALKTVPENIKDFNETFERHLTEVKLITREEGPKHNRLRRLSHFENCENFTKDDHVDFILANTMSKRRRLSLPQTFLHSSDGQRLPDSSIDVKKVDVNEGHHLEFLPFIKSQFSSTGKLSNGNINSRKNGNIKTTKNQCKINLPNPFNKKLSTSDSPYLLNNEMQNNSYWNTIDENKSKENNANNIFNVNYEQNQGKRNNIDTYRAEESNNQGPIHNVHVNYSTIRADARSIDNIFSINDCTNITGENNVENKLDINNDLDQSPEDANLDTTVWCRYPGGRSKGSPGSNTNTSFKNMMTSSGQNQDISYPFLSLQSEASSVGPLNYPGNKSTESSTKGFVNLTENKKQETTPNTSNLFSANLTGDNSFNSEIVFKTSNTKPLKKQSLHKKVRDSFKGLPKMYLRAPTKLPVVRSKSDPPRSKASFKSYIFSDPLSSSTSSFSQSSHRPLGPSKSLYANVRPSLHDIFSTNPEIAEQFAMMFPNDPKPVWSKYFKQSLHKAGQRILGKQPENNTMPDSIKDQLKHIYVY